MIVSTFLKLAVILLTSCCHWIVASNKTSPYWHVEKQGVIVRIDEDSSQLCCEHDDCLWYRGLQSKTAYGATCLPWKDLPTSSEWHPDKWPYSGLVSNYCRNPGGEEKNAWCIVRLNGDLGRPDWENCAVPNCTATDTETCCDGNCASYRGKLSTTKTGKRCVPWSDLGAKETYHPEKHPRAGLELNYCRNPDVNYPNAWCYTKIKGLKWEDCALPYCTAKDSENCCEDKKCISYRGKLSTTNKGKKCLKWKDNKETDRYHPDNPKMQNYGLQHNYCRNPSKSKWGAWCYTSWASWWPFSKHGYEYCFLPGCPTVRRRGCALYDARGQHLGKMDHYYCRSHHGPQLYHGCMDSNEGKGQGFCWMQTEHGKEHWCYSGNSVKRDKPAISPCNPYMTPVAAGKFCFERAHKCVGETYKIFPGSGITN